MLAALFFLSMGQQAYSHPTEPSTDQPLLHWISTRSPGKSHLETHTESESPPYTESESPPQPRSHPLAGQLPSMDALPHQFPIPQLVSRLSALLPDHYSPTPLTLPLQAPSNCYTLCFHFLLTQSSIQYNPDSSCMSRWLGFHSGHTGLLLARPYLPGHSELRTVQRRSQLFVRQGYSTPPSLISRRLPICFPASYFLCLTRLEHPTLLTASLFSYFT